MIDRQDGDRRWLSVWTVSTQVWVIGARLWIIVPRWALSMVLEDCVASVVLRHVGDG